VLDKFSRSDKGFGGLGCSDFNDNRKRLAEILKKLNERESLFGHLERLDGLILDNIEDWIKQHFPKEVYFLRLHLLDYFMQASNQGKFLVFGTAKGLPSKRALIVETKEDDYKGNIAVEFYKVVLNKYYSEFQDYKIQPSNFNHRLFRKCFTIEGTVWGFLREAYCLLRDAYEFDVHRKSSPTVEELLSNVSQIDENKELPNTDVAVILWNAYEAISKAHNIYEENIRESPRDEDCEIDPKEDESFKTNLENYADKELPSDAGKKMLPYLNEAEKYLIEAENFLKISKEEMPRFWDLPAPIRQEEKELDRLEEDERFSKIAEQIVERHNKYGVTLTNPETGEDLLAGMTDEQRENYRQFKIKTSRIRQEEKERGNK
jgi:hypothetical protein